MKDIHRIIVQNRRIRYDFTVRRNITVVQGDSATGKTTLVEMIREYYENGPDSGIQLQSDKECFVLSGRNWRNALSIIKDSIVFIDEGSDFIFTNDFAAYIKSTDNYYVIITRESIPSLPYSVEEIYGIRNSGKYGTLKQTYNEFFHIYNLPVPYQEKLNPNIIITEDSNSGYQFFKAVSDSNNIRCDYAAGKSNIFAKTIEFEQKFTDNCILIIADGAAFGSEMAKISVLMGMHKNIYLYLPESFEWLILKSGIIDNNEMKNILAAPYEYIESRQYFSWERFFTALLIERTADTYLNYTKKILNPSYLNKKIAAKILKVIEHIQLNV